MKKKRGNSTKKDMKIIYEFDPIEDKEDLLIHQKAVSNHCKLYDIEQYIRKLRKYDDRNVVDKQEIIDAINEIIYERD